MKLKQLLEITIENQDNEKRLTGKDLNILNSIVKLNQMRLNNPSFWWAKVSRLIAEVFRLNRPQAWTK